MLLGTVWESPTVLFVESAGKSSRQMGHEVERNKCLCFKITAIIGTDSEQKEKMVIMIEMIQNITS